MLKIIYTNFLKTMAVTALIVTHSGARADKTDPVEPTQNASSRLQVTGSKAQFSIDADHADVQTALSTIFVQAGKQFDVANSVAGQVTLKLSSQSLDTVLASLCRQTFLKYRIDTATMIYHFEEDTDAVKAAFVRIESLNALLKQQLRDLGLDLPADSLLDSSLSAPGGRAGALRRGAQAGGQGGFGGGGNAIGQQDKVDSANGAAAGANTFKPLYGGGAGTRTAGPATADRSISTPSGQSGPLGRSLSSGDQKSVRSKDGTIETDYLPADLVKQLMTANGISDGGNNTLTLQKGYLDFLKQNNLIAIDTHGTAVPVVDVLAELGRQSGVVVLLDPMVPRGNRFRINLVLPACSLNEALNLVLPPAHLRWRTINGTIYVTPTPDFQIFYGNSPVPNVIYGGAYSNSQQRAGGQQNSNQGGQSGGGQGGRPN